MTSPRLCAEQRRALTLLASIPYGIAEELPILAHRFDRAPAPKKGSSGAMEDH
jgi:hypothetical protein